MASTGGRSNRASTHARGRGRGRSSGREPPEAARRSHQPNGRHTGLGGDQLSQEDCELERLAHKFCSRLYEEVRLESVRTLGRDRDDSVESNNIDDQWFVVVMHEFKPDNRHREPNQPDPTWRRMREKLEAVKVLSILACTETFAWRRNRSFWRRFTDDGSRKSDRDDRYSHPSAIVVPASRDDHLMPRFLLDFSFAEISKDVVTLLLHVLLGSEKSMRISFKNAMETLATIPLRSTHRKVIPVVLRFARCQFSGADIVTRLVHLVESVNQPHGDAQRGQDAANSPPFRFHVVELDLEGAQLSRDAIGSLRQLALLSRGQRLRLVLDKTLHMSTDLLIPFGALLSSWFQLGKPRSLAVDDEPKPEDAEPRWKIVSRPDTLHDVSLNSCALSSPHVTSLFSAIRASSIRCLLSLRGAFQCCDARLAWAWVVFSVWCGGATGSVVSMDLSSNVLRRADVAAVKRVIDSPREERARTVYEFQHGARKQGSTAVHAQKSKVSSKQSRRTMNAEQTTHEETWSRAQLRAGAKLYRSDATKTTGASLVLTSAAIVEIVDSRDGLAAVLVPGYGVLWVDSSALELGIDPPHEEQREQTLEELRMNSMLVPEGEEPATVFEALFSSLLLSSLTKLELDGNALDQAALRAVLSACPSIKTLSVEECELNSITAIVNAYAAGGCRIESLNLAENLIGDRDIVELCRLIARTPCPASQIRALNLHANPVGRQGLQALHFAIRENRSLAHLVLDRSQDVDSQFRPVFYPFHDQFLGVEPLSVAHQREFHRALGSRLEIVALDVSIVARIFEFASCPIHRRITWS